MSFKLAGCLDCSLTDYLKELSELESDREKAVFAAVVLSYLGYFQSDQETLDERNLRQLTDMLVERGQDSFPPDFQQRCMQCPSKANCPVGKIILKS
jgi:hypothetical protein